MYNQVTASAAAHILAHVLNGKADTPKLNGVPLNH